MTARPRLTVTPREGRCCRCGQHVPSALPKAGDEELCEQHLVAVLGPIRDRVIDQVGLDGVGRLVGRMRPEYGILVGELECTSCGAGWVGVLGDACGWCERLRAGMVEHQREVLLRGPDRRDFPSFAAFVDGMSSWGERLQRAVTAGLITRDEAHGRQSRKQSVGRDELERSR